MLQYAQRCLIRHERNCCLLPLELSVVPRAYLSPHTCNGNPVCSARRSSCLTSKQSFDPFKQYSVRSCADGRQIAELGDLRTVQSAADQHHKVRMLISISDSGFSSCNLVSSIIEECVPLIAGAARLDLGRGCQTPASCKICGKLNVSQQRTALRRLHSRSLQQPLLISLTSYPSSPPTR